MIETSFYELRMKNVINVIDGRNLGNICDIVLEICSGKILGFIVPGKKRWYHIFKSCDDIFIPYHNICKIGVDSILVELTCTEQRNFQTTSFSEVSLSKDNCCEENLCKCEIDCKELNECKNNSNKNKCNSSCPYKK